MKRLILCLSSTAVFAAVFLMQGCSGSSTSTTPAAAPTNSTAASSMYPGLPTEAQPKLQTMKLWLGSQEMEAELALTPLQEETGMMFRTNMGANEGMLFPMPQPMQASFWMMNTILPLSAAYIAPDGTILEIHDLKPHDTNSVLSSNNNILFVLEAPKDYFKTNHLDIGTVVTTEHGPLRSVFTPGR